MGTRFLLFISIISIFFCTSCTTTNIGYFQNIRDTSYRKMLPSVEAPLHKNDFLSIAISSANAEASSVFNPVISSTERTAAVATKYAQYKGYLVNEEGYIQLPILGNIMVEGLTKTQLRNQILKTITDKKLLIDPIVDIRLLNFEVTILGEVTTPTVITVPSEKISLVKALGMAGDITVYGKKGNVLLIREEDGARVTRYINLKSSDFLNSEYYYLKPNDVIYVEPNKAKVALSGKTQQILPLALTGASILVLVLERVIK